MMKSLIRVTGALVLATVMVAAWQPGSADGASRRRSRDDAAARDSRSEDAKRVEQAVEAAERAGVGRRDLRELRELCERGDFSEAQTVRIFSLAAQLALEELPVESFAAKIGEGVSKRVDSQRILQVAERRALLLKQAKSILNGILLEGAPVRDREELIPDVAAALEAGQTAEKVRSALTAGFREGESIGEIRQGLFP